MSRNEPLFGAARTARRAKATAALTSAQKEHDDAWAAVAARGQQDLKWAAGPRDEPMPLSGVAARLDRAFKNFMETFPFFAAAVLTAYLAGKSGKLCGVSLMMIGGTIASVQRIAVWIIMYALAGYAEAKRGNSAPA